MKVLLVPNYSRTVAVDDARRLADWLEDQGVEVVWAPDKKLFPDKPVDVDGASLVVSLGGDGTLLRAARIVGYREIPLLGAAYGHLGFLTNAASDNLIEAVSDALAGEMHVSRRATLEVTTLYERPDGTTFEATSFALNELALSHGIMGDMVEFDVSVSGNHIDRLRGDGFVVSTATGSTGYALSAGGPIVTPEFTGMVCVPVAPHTILARAFLTSSSDVVEISLSPDRPVARHFFADGQPVAGDAAGMGVHAAVRRGPGDILLLERNVHGFYDSVSRVFYGNVDGRRAGAGRNIGGDWK